MRPSRLLLFLVLREERGTGESVGVGGCMVIRDIDAAGESEAFKSQIYFLCLIPHCNAINPNESTHP